MKDRLFITHPQNCCGDEVWQIVDNETWSILSSVSTREKAFEKLKDLVTRCKHERGLNRALSEVEVSLSVPPKQVAEYEELYQDYLEDYDLKKEVQDLIENIVSEVAKNSQPLRRVKKVLLLHR